VPHTGISCPGRSGWGSLFGDLMRKKLIHVLNWDKYQARSDKELPWCKLWGTLFKRPWFQEMKDDEKFCTIAILDLARQFNNRIDEESLFNGYLSRNYGIFMSKERVINLCKSLSYNEFLSDNIVGLEGDKKRQDKDKIRDNSKTPQTLDETKAYFQELGKTLEAEKFFDYYSSKGWLVGRSPMKDWKSAARNWCRNAKTYNPKPVPNVSTDNGKDKEQLEKWKKEAAPMPKECREQLTKFGIRSGV